MLEVAMEDLKRAAKDFHTLTGATLVLFDESRRLLYAYPERICPFCEHLRTCDALRDDCLNCDRLGFDECDRTKLPHVYRCHMGLSEAITPIYENEILLGYLMMGGILCNENEALLQENILRVCASYGLRRDTLKELADKLIRTDEERIYAALHVTSMCACYLYCNNIIRNHSELLSAQLKEYVDRHFTEAITVPSLCKSFYVSRTKLYQLSIKAFGMSATDYMRQKRMQLAKRLLLSTDRSIAQISHEVGYADTNYFTRVFKADVGTSPLIYRKQEKTALKTVILHKKTQKEGI